MTTFQNLKDTERPFVSTSQDVVDFLESITAREKADAVPYINIWQINTADGRPMHCDSAGRPTAPITLQLVTPPVFGASTAESIRFRERPPVSLEKVSITSEAPNGIITFRKIVLQFVVHRPEVIFGEKSDSADSWSELITPGSVFGMEYGWHSSTAIKNPILNGEGIGDVSSVGRINFAVTNYNFRINPMNEIHVTVHGMEDGEFGMRQMFLGVDELKKEEFRVKSKDPVDPYSEIGQALVETIKKMMKVIVTDPKAETVPFGKLADELIAPAFTNVYRKLGYSDIKLVMGIFNTKAGWTSAKHGEVDLSGKSIRDFPIRVKEVTDRLSYYLRSGLQLTVQELLRSFLEEMQDPSSWNSTKARADANGVPLFSMPDVVFRTRVNGSSIGLYVVDNKREMTKFSENDRVDFLKMLAGRRPTREEIRKQLAAKNIPMISLLKGNSYIRDSNFEAHNDDQIKSLFIRRAFDTFKTRKEITQRSGLKTKTGSFVDPRQLLYSSAIRGDITLLGNFAFDIFELVWLDFGIPRWDGPFRIARREDSLDRSGFVSKLTLYSAGGDPLGTQALG